MWVTDGYTKEKYKGRIGEKEVTREEVTIVEASDLDERRAFRKIANELIDYAQNG